MPRRSVIRAVATVAGFSVVTRLLSFLFKIYLSRTVGAEVIGLYQIALSVFFLFSTLSTGGLPTVLSRRIAEDNAVGQGRGSRYFTGALLLVGAVALVTIGVLAPASPYLTGLFSDERALPLFRVMLPALLSTALYSVVRAWFWGNKCFTEYSVTETLEEVLRIVSTMLFTAGVFSGIQGAYGIALAFTVSDMAVAVVLCVLFFLRGGRLSRRPLIKELALPALPLSAMRLFGSFVGTVIALILPARLIAGGMSVAQATAGVGRISGMANPLLFAPNALIGSLIIVLIPEMSEHAARGNLHTLGDDVNGGISVSLVISGLFVTLFLALGEPLTRLLYADAESGRYLSFAAYLMLLMPVSQMTTSTLNSIGLEKESFLTYVVGTALLLLCVYFLPRYLGIYAVIVANFASLSVSAIGNLLILRNKISLKIGFLKPLLLVALFALPSAYLAYTLYALCGRGVGGTLLGGAAGAAFYTALVLLFGLVRPAAFFARKAKKRSKRVATRP